MSRFQKNFKKWPYKTSTDDPNKGYFNIPYRDRYDLVNSICEEFSWYKDSQIIKDYELKDADGNYYKSNSSSRDFEKTQLYKNMGINKLDILASLEYSEFVKADIDRDIVSNTEYKDYLSGREPIENAPVVYVFRSWYYLDDKNVVPLYVKINFGYNRTEDKSIQDCLYIKSIHIDENLNKDKVFFFKDSNKDLCAKPVSERSYEYINENDYLKKHPEETMQNDISHNR